MLSERRKHRRYAIDRIAKFRSDIGSLPRDCMITDISNVGARLFVDSVEMPDQFHLMVAGEEGTHHDCRVVWRLGGEIGVAFVGQPQRERRPRA